MSFEEFYEKTKDEEAHKNVKWFLKKQIKPGIAVDLGCGAGKDTVCLLKNGWTVYAFDAEDTEQFILEKLTEEEKKRFKFKQALIQNIEIPKCDLVVANYCMHYLKKEEFKDVLEKIYSSLNSGGYFLAILLGERDSWAQEQQDNAFFSVRQLDELMKKKFKLEVFKTDEYPGETATGEEKYWHTISLVNRCVNKNLINTKRKRDEEEER